MHTHARIVCAALCVFAVTETHAQQAARPAAPLPEPRTAVAVPWPNNTSWRHIGPASFGGRVDDIEAVPGTPRIIFVASASGGVFRSTNNGTTWAAVSDPYFATMSVGDIAIAPGNPNIVWAGMGEPNNRQSSTWGDGVYKSDDGGTTWRHMGLRETQSIGRVVIDPTNPEVVFVAAVGHLFGPNEERGVYRTRDGGRTWSKVLGVDANTGATDIIISPDGRTLVAAMYQRRRRAFGFAGSGPGSGMYRSTDGGDTWLRITNGLPQEELGRIGLDISRSNPDIMFAVVEARAAGGVYRSVDRGSTWTRQSSTNPRPSYFSQIRIDPKNPDHIWLLGVYLAESNDAGATFSTDEVDGYAHPDHHAMWIDPDDPQHIMLGNDGGVNFSYDNGRTWTYVDNLPLGQFYDIVIDDREPYWIYGGTQDNGSFAFPSATYSRGGMTKLEVINTVFGDGFHGAVDPADRRWIYANSQNGRLFLFDMVTREEKHIQPTSPLQSEPYRFNWNTGSAVSAAGYYLGAHKLLRTADRGHSWQELSPDVTKNLGRNMSVGEGFAPRSLSSGDGVSNYGNITTISESPKDARIIYIGTDDGNVQMTADGGRTWTDLTPRFRFPRAPASYVSEVVASRHDTRTAYVTFDGHWDDDMRPYVFRTTDGGATWTSIAANLPDWKPVKTIAEDPRNPRVLYLGTEFGLYWSFDGGAHWTAATGNVPPVMIPKIVVNERNGDLILGTHGRGVIILDNASPLSLGDPLALSEDITLVPLQPVTQAQRYREFPQPGADEFVAPNPAYGTYITYIVKNDPPAGSPGARITIVAPDGSTITEMTGPDAKGTHRVLWDLRYRFMYVPQPADSGFYGAPRAALVPPGTYTVKLNVRGRDTSQPVTIRWDPRGASSPDALSKRFAMNTQGRELSRVYYETIRAIEALTPEVARFSEIAKQKQDAAADSLIGGLTSSLTQMRARAASGMGSGPGNLFDLLAAVESSSLPPTQAQERMMTTIVDNSAAVARDINEIITVRMPALRARLGQPASSSVQPIRPPR
jgi:photosystem II stability/assembly factor-like uncharacterized protein